MITRKSVIPIVLRGLLVLLIATAAGCASVESEKSMYAWTPIRTTGQVDAHAWVETRHVFGREIEESSLFIDKEEERATFKELALADLTQSGLFASVNAPGRQPDLVLMVETRESMPKGIWTMEFALGVSITVQDPVSRTAVQSYSREATLRGFTMKQEIGVGFGKLFADIRQEILADYQAGKIRSVIAGVRASSAAQGHLATAQTALAAGDFVKAITSLRLARQADPQGAAPAAAAVTLLHRLCDPEGAKRLGEEARKARPADAGLTAAIAGTAVTPHPPACQAQQLNRDGVALARKEKRAEALAKFQAARQAAPGLAPKASYNAALLLEQSGKPQDALVAYLEARRAFLDPAEEREALGRLTALAQRANLPAPDAADRRYRLGIVRAQQKRYPEAVTEFEAALAEAPWLADAYYNLGLVYDFTGQSAPALQALRTYLSLSPTAPNAGAVKTKIVELEDKLGVLPEGK